MPEISDILKEVKKVRSELGRLEKKFNLMVERKVQETGGGTFFVTLPKGWCKKLGIKRGNKVTLVWSKDDSLTIVA